MISRSIRSSIKSYFSNVDWKLLAFLLLFLNVKLILKLLALLFIYLINPDFKFGFRFKNSRLPLFYILIIGIGVVDWAIYKGYASINYSLVSIAGIIFWLACILPIHQVKLFIERIDSKIIYQTLVAFFVLNAIVSFAELIRIVFETGAINPYRYQGNFQKYFINTGDYIKGISFDTCTTNAILNSFGIVLFLFRKNVIMVLVCMIVLLLTASNLVNLMVLFVFLLLFILKTDKDQKSVLVVCSFLLIIFFVKISPQNNGYVSTGLQKTGLFEIKNEHSSNKEFPMVDKPDSLLTAEERKQKLAKAYLDSIRMILLLQKKTVASNSYASFALSKEPKLEIPTANIHTPPYQHRNDTNAARQKLLQFIDNTKLQFPASYSFALPGKFVSFQQTFRFLYQHPLHSVLGNGIGNFSSKLAFRATALNVSGGYPAALTYINKDFFDNHLKLYLFYFSADKEKHSIINSPNSVYNQLAGEYGMTGVFAFIIFYVGFFLKNNKKLSYGIPLLFLLLGFFLMDYWFEQLSVVVFFELLLFLNLKESTENE